MIRNRLNILLAERNLSIKDVYENTGLSRTTVSNMINGVSDGLQMKTLDILCNYLEVTPSDFFDYAPFIYKFHSGEKRDYEIIIEIKNGESLRTYWYKVYYDLNEDYITEEARLEKFDLYITLDCSLAEDPFIEEVYNTLSITLKNDLKMDFVEFILDQTAQTINQGNLKEKRTKIAINNTKEMKTLFRTPVGTFVKTFDPMTELFV